MQHDDGKRRVLVADGDHIKPGDPDRALVHWRTCRSACAAEIGERAPTWVRNVSAETLSCPMRGQSGGCGPTWVQGSLACAPEIGERAPTWVRDVSAETLSGPMCGRRGLRTHVGAGLDRVRA